MKTISHLAFVALAASTALFGAPSFAFTDKPVKLVVPAPAGGTMDVAARIIGDALSQEIKQPVIVENKPGAGGAIGVKYMLSQPADGQTLMVTASNVLTEIPHVLKGGFDPLLDVMPIAPLAHSTLVFIASPQFPATNLKDAIAYVKANPRQVSFASYGAGSASQYAGVILNQKAQLDMQHVPFPGSPPALAQVMGGQIPLMFDGSITSRPLVAAGKVRLLGVAAKNRLPDFPNVPTLAEAGYPELNFRNWVGIIAPSKVPPQLAARIHATFLKIATTPAFKERLASTGFDPVVPRLLEESAGEVREEFARNADIVKTFGIRLD